MREIDTCESFNYTEWQRDLWSDKTVDEVFLLAAEREKARAVNPD